MANEREPIIRHFIDIGFTVRARLPCSDEIYHCDFEVFKIVSGDSAEVAWQKAGEDVEPIPVEYLDEAECFLSGHVKWDGCSNWNFDEQEKVSIHFCSVQQAMNIGVLFERLYRMAKELLPNYEGD